jgi:rhamnose transport system substrate-binding protein
MNKRIAVMTVLVAAIAAAAGLLASTSGGATRASRTIAIVRGTNGYYDDVLTGAKAASAALGDRLRIEVADDATTQTSISSQVSIIKSLIKKHVDAIAVDPTDHPRALKPVLAQARAAGIAALSFSGSIHGSTVSVINEGASAYTHALLNALAAQMGQKGEYMVIACRPANAIVQTWLHTIEGVPQGAPPLLYPQMERVGVVYGDDSGGPQEVARFAHLIKTHPDLRGLIALCPAEAYAVPRAISRAGEVGKVFAAGDGQGCPPVDPQLAPYVRQGAEELVCEGVPSKLGYATAWAADYLASGHTFRPGPYNVGGPVGTVHYFGPNKELRVGMPLTITKANLDKYSG